MKTTEVKHKYDVGDEVWCVYCHHGEKRNHTVGQVSIEAVKYYIGAILIPAGIYYDVEGVFIGIDVMEQHLYPTREEAMAALERQEDEVGS